MKGVRWEDEIKEERFKALVRRQMVKCMEKEGELTGEQEEARLSAEGGTWWNGVNGVTHT